MLGNRAKQCLLITIAPAKADCRHRPTNPPYDGRSIRVPTMHWSRYAVSGAYRPQLMRLARWGRL